MSDYNEELSELYQTVVQEELGLTATVDEFGWVQFSHPELGEFEIILREYSPEYMQISWRFFNDENRKREDLLQVCNTVNQSELAKLWVSEKHSIVRACLGLLVAAPSAMPDEDLLRAVIPKAMSSIIAAVEVFGKELEKFDESAKAG